MAIFSQPILCFVSRWIMIPLNKIDIINPVIMKENLSKEYIQIVSIDGYDF